MHAMQDMFNTMQDNVNAFVADVQSGTITAFENMQNGATDTLNKCVNMGSSVLSELEYFLTLKQSIKTYDGKYNSVRISTNTKALHVMLHGMNSSSGQFQLHMNEVEKYNFEHDDKISVFAPEIIEKGFVELELSGEDVFSKLEPHIERIMNSNISIFLIGISNGGRVALYVYSRIMEKYNYKNVFVTDLGSPIKGTLMADILLASKLHKFSNYRENEDVLEELKLNSDTATSLLAKCESYPNFKINTMFYFARYDALVNSKEYIEDYDDENVKVEDTVGHNGLIRKCYKEQIEWCIEKMNACNEHTIL